MFEIGFTELIVIGVVALIVIGPERLPKVARMAGHLYGRMQRYVSPVKSDISQEIQLDEIRRAGQNFKNSIESTVSGVEQQATVV
ncbi:MAG TPA: Sec-independent protein translocase protein TatB, partial [Gammaproteobacteria bacterium]|nr:Sec-independent protein translocase protein TatB [Gammaproteobacteria bacterium]